ncbi:hypothetical protein [Lignipirellula cremea]|uniref:hypothetical protein n=1 Tax=Lignipirellula cremea TaxID=2528010 RepID=UPI0011A5A1C2|nr:hypothetical protein [Lignipirellula cremea]
MAIETRDLETRYFDVEGATLIRIQRVRGEFDVYDGFLETLNASFWLEYSDDRRPVTHAGIGTLIKGNQIEPVGLAKYFADANDLGSVIARGKKGGGKRGPSINC